MTNSWCKGTLIQCYSGELKENMKRTLEPADMHAYAQTYTKLIGYLPISTYQSCFFKTCVSRNKMYNARTCEFRSSQNYIMPIKGFCQSFPKLKKSKPWTTSHPRQQGINKERAQTFIFSHFKHTETSCHGGRQFHYGLNSTLSRQYKNKRSRDGWCTGTYMLNIPSALTPEQWQKPLECQHIYLTHIQHINNYVYICRQSLLYSILCSEMCYLTAEAWFWTHRACGRKTWYNNSNWFVSVWLHC